MRTVRLLVTSAMCAMALLVLPAQAARKGHNSPAHLYTGMDATSGGFGTGPYWQGEPTDHRAIWRYGYYQGNDPDQFIRDQLIRDPRNYAH